MPPSIVTLFASQALLGVLPYILFAILTKARIQPVLNEAMDMLILTNGAFETICETRKPIRISDDDDDDDVDSDASDDPENYAKRCLLGKKKRRYEGRSNDTDDAQFYSAFL